MALCKCILSAASCLHNLPQQWGPSVVLRKEVQSHCETAPTYKHCVLHEFQRFPTYHVTNTPHWAFSRVWLAICANGLRRPAGGKHAALWSAEHTSCLDRYVSYVPPDGDALISTPWFLLRFKSNHHRHHAIAENVRKSNTRYCITGELAQGQTVGVVVPLLVVAKIHHGETKVILLLHTCLDGCVLPTTTHHSQNGRACGTNETYLAFCIQAAFSLRPHVQTGSRLLVCCKAGHLLYTPAKTAQCLGRHHKSGFLRSTSNKAAA